MAGEKFVKEFASIIESLGLHQQKLLSLFEIHRLLCGLDFINTKKLSDDHP